MSREMLELGKIFNEKDRQYLEEALKKDKDDFCWYVLHYDMATCKYLNEPKFMGFDRALDVFNTSSPILLTDRIELIYSPRDENQANCIVYVKTTFDMLEKITQLAYDHSCSYDELADMWVEMDEYITNVNEILDQNGIENLEQLEKILKTM